jgi:hypothetical protein
MYPLSGGVSMKLLVALLAALLISCGAQKVEVKKNPPVAGCIWVGGKDGGCWIKIDTLRGAFYAEIYYESRELWTKGRFKLNEGNYNRAEIIKNLSGYDGEKILLNLDGKYLAPIKE